MPAIDLDAFRMCSFKASNTQQVILLSFSLIFGKPVPFHPYRSLLISGNLLRPVLPPPPNKKITKYRSLGVPDRRLDGLQIQRIWKIKGPLDPRQDRQGRDCVLHGHFHIASPCGVFCDLRTGE